MTGQIILDYSIPLKGEVERVAYVHLLVRLVERLGTQQLRMEYSASPPEEKSGLDEHYRVKYTNRVKVN